MKKIMLLMALYMCCQGVYSQRDYQSCCAKIDSLVKVYSITKEKPYEGDIFFFDKINLSKQDKEHLITRLSKLYKQKKYVNLYSLADELLYSLFRKTLKGTTLRQQLIETSLEHYYYPNQTHQIHSEDTIADYTIKARKLLLSVLQEKGKEKLYPLYIKKVIGLGYDDLEIPEAKKILKESGREGIVPLQQIRDSIIENKYVMPWAKGNFNAACISENNVWIIGLLNMHECMPELNKRLAEWTSRTDGTFPIFEARCALARMGDQGQIDYLIANYLDYSDNLDLRYLRSEQILWAYLEYNHKITGGINIDPDSRDKSLTPISDLGISYIYPYIKNLPPNLKVSPYPKLMQDLYDQLDAVYDWLMKNRDKVVFDFDRREQPPL